jgi:pimeloyl-ACP methyl ester carboxylesterase
MTEALPRKTEEQECGIRIERCRLHAKAWTPGSPEASRTAPSLLFHVSLGCVELWRSFPNRLASATGRRVIACDRLGFGGSDAHPGRLELEFISTEARHVVPRLGEQLGVGEFVACGHSVGGGMAVETAARSQTQCQALVTIAAQAFVEDKALAGFAPHNVMSKAPPISRSWRDTTATRPNGWWMPGSPHGSRPNSRAGALTRP